MFLFQEATFTFRLDKKWFSCRNIKFKWESKGCFYFSTDSQKVIRSVLISCYICSCKKILIHFYIFFYLIFFVFQTVREMERCIFKKDPLTFLKKLEDTGPFCWATDACFGLRMWCLPRVLKSSLACFLVSVKWVPQIHLWCDTCWSLDSQHCSWAFLIHVLAHVHKRTLKIPQNEN